MKIAGVILVVAGLGLAGVTGWLAVEQSQSAAAREATIDSLAAEREVAIEELHKVKLDTRAVMKSMDVQPDSVRMKESLKISRRLRDLNTRSRQLEMNQTEMARLMRRQEAYMEEDAAAARRRALPFAVGGAVCIVAGVLLVWTGRRQGA